MYTVDKQIRRLFQYIFSVHNLKTVQPKSRLTSKYPPPGTVFYCLKLVTKTPITGHTKPKHLQALI